jgi:hypothetical protein
MLLTKRILASNKDKDDNSQEVSKSERIILVFEKSSGLPGLLTFGLKKNKKLKE